MSRLLILIVLVFAAPTAWAVPTAWAAEKATPLTHMSISLADCKKLTQDRMRNDVTFKPGVDVNGRHVVPAAGDFATGDFATGILKAPDEIVIDFGLDLAGRYGIVGSGFYKVTAGILTVHFDPDTGKLTFNGKPLLRADAQAVTKACETLKSTKKAKPGAR